MISVFFYSNRPTLDPLLFSFFLVFYAFFNDFTVLVVGQSRTLYNWGCQSQRTLVILALVFTAIYANAPPLSVFATCNRGNQSIRIDGVKFTFINIFLLLLLSKGLTACFAYRFRMSSSLMSPFLQSFYFILSLPCLYLSAFSCYPIYWYLHNLMPVLAIRFVPFSLCSNTI